MGSGKSTVGRALAARLALPFVDLDDAIERDARRTIAELFAAEGEAAFREREGKMLQKLTAEPGVRVFALGGGTITDAANLARVDHEGVRVYLRTGVEALVQRLESERAQRPLLSGTRTPEELRTRLKKLHGEREAAYASARVVVDTEGKSPEAIAKEIEAQL